jgi:hypothetical protein
MKRIPLTQGKYAIVDDEDFADLSKRKWCAAKHGNTYYAESWDGALHRNVSMHRLIMSPPHDKVIDHKNRDGLDNRRSNLRICTQRENMYNRAPTVNIRFDMTGKRRRRWLVRIRHGRRAFTKYCMTREEAVVVRNAQMKAMRGEFAVVI